MPLEEPVAAPRAAWTAHTCLRGLNGAAARSAPGFISPAPASDLAAPACALTSPGAPMRATRAGGSERWRHLVFPRGASRGCHRRPPFLPFSPAGSLILRSPLPDPRAPARRTVPSPDQGAQRANTSFPFPKVKDMRGT